LIGCNAAKVYDGPCKSPGVQSRAYHEETAMRSIALAFGALALVASSAVPASAQTQDGPPKTYAKKAPRQGNGDSPSNSAQPRGNGYREQLADKLPMGSTAWWEQMRREGRLGGESP
jgi:hypothetical protein